MSTVYNYYIAVIKVENGLHVDVFVSSADHRDLIEESGWHVVASGERAASSETEIKEAMTNSMTLEDMEKYADLYFADKEDDEVIEMEMGGMSVADSTKSLGSFQYAPQPHTIIHRDPSNPFF